MSEDIKILEEFIEPVEFGEGQRFVYKKVYYAIYNLIKAYKILDKDNNDLRRLYRRTAKKLRENGKEELSNYFLAQIYEVPTFTVDDDIDYYTEYYKFRNGEIFSTKQLKHIEENQKKYFINKQKIKDEIEELKEMKDGGEVFTTAVNFAIKVLEELLGDEK